MDLQTYHRRSSEFEKDCQEGKNHRMSFDEGQDWREKRFFKLAHANLCGPINMASIIDVGYFLLSIEDFNRKMLVYS